MNIALEHPPIHYTEPRTLLPREVWQALTADVIKAHPGTGRVLAKRIIGQTVAFLIAGTMTDRPLSPSEYVDWGWHAFLLRTQAYQEFCERHAGRFVHHHPGVPDAAETGGPEVARNRTVAAIRAAGFDLDQGLWPNAAECTQCHSGCTDSPVGGKK
ncbi:glycine-rich domain-containing protein [Streptomyces sp. NPDC048370]|uniref:glycine-rich domain-containing protein n=1 Tax=Streptomyces sp. NPDC048370 TaxID=3365540 RepID=UPI003717B6F6